MEQTIKAVYKQGHFVPQEPCDVPEGAEIELILQGPARLSPTVANAQERTRILQEVLEHMVKNPLPVSTKQLTREVLHGRH
ncbi:MAG: antitoxin AF2212-like protein [Candidatus Bipolaricaulia bacterium]